MGARSEASNRPGPPPTDRLGGAAGSDEAPSWLALDSAAAWSHGLALKDLDPIFAGAAPRSVLTVGDGRSGQEARYFKALGHRAVASDVWTERLRIVKQHGLIDDCLELDAERVELPDGAFDFTFAKETLHHLERPYLGLYEMLRVARMGAVIVEPHYRYPSTVMSCLRQIFRQIARRGGAGHAALLPRVTYETAGNLLYRFNPYELTQVALAMGITATAFRYSHRVPEEAAEEIRGEAAARWIEHRKRKLARIDARKGARYRALLTFAFFKAPIGRAQMARLRGAGFSVPDLKANPYGNAPK